VPVSIPSINSLISPCAPLELPCVNVIVYKESFNCLLLEIKCCNLFNSPSKILFFSVTFPVIFFAYSILGFKFNIFLAFAIGVFKSEFSASFNDSNIICYILVYGLFNLILCK